MPNALKRQLNDLGVISIPPQSSYDGRVRLAEEDALQALIAGFANTKGRSASWVQTPTLSIDSNRRLGIAGTFRSSIYPDLLPINSGVIIPSLSSPDEVLNRLDRLYLLVFGAIVGEEHDPDIGNISFDYYDDDQITLRAETKENALRARSYYAFVLAPAAIDGTALLAVLPDAIVPPGGQARLTGTKLMKFTGNAETGFSSGSLRIFPSDPLLALNVDYPIINDFVELTEICKIKRVQNYTKDGYTWGRNGEEPLTNAFSLVNSAAAKEADRDARIRSKFNDIISGVGLKSRAILNLAAGAIVGNQGREGRSASSPNGSFAVANGQRISFLNSAVLQNECCKVSEAGNDGSGNALITFELDTNVPSGTLFSDKALDHRVFDANGNDQTSFGSFVNLGRSGSLIWVASANSTVKPGQITYFSPAIKYPSGSGFDLPFIQAEQVWVAGTPLNPLNIRIGYLNDPSGYEQPIGSDFIPVFSPERAGLLYILKKVSVPTDANGTAYIGSGSKGNFAWIEGISTRVDAPIKKGLQPNATYNALVYYAPAAAETWQVQISYCSYRGLSDGTFLNGATVASRPFALYTTQGGGSTVFQSDAAIRYRPIGMELPSNNGVINSYQLDTPIRFVGESNLGAFTTREGDILPGGGVLPAPGMVMSFTASVGIGSGREVNGVLSVGGNTIGFKTAPLVRGKPYLAVVCFMAKKGDVERLVIATRVTIGGESIVFDSSTDTAFDIFEV